MKLRTLSIMILASAFMLGSTASSLPVGPGDAMARQQDRDRKDDHDKDRGHRGDRSDKDRDHHGDRPHKDRDHHGDRPHKDRDHHGDRPHKGGGHGHGHGHGPKDPKPHDPKPHDPKPHDPKPHDPDPKPDDPTPETPTPTSPEPEKSGISWSRGDNSGASPSTVCPWDYRRKHNIRFFEKCYLPRKH